MEKILTIYDEDELYCKRLSLYLRQNTKLPFQIYPMSTPEHLEEFLKKKSADLLLLSEKNAKSLHFSPKSGRTLYLTEESPLSKKKKENVIYKYQSADRIMREILLQYGELALLENNGQGRADIFMIYSPLGRCFFPFPSQVPPLNSRPILPAFQALKVMKQKKGSA